MRFSKKRFSWEQTVQCIKDEMLALTLHASLGGGGHPQFMTHEEKMVNTELDVTLKPCFDPLPHPGSRPSIAGQPPWGKRARPQRDRNITFISIIKYFRYHWHTLNTAGSPKTWSRNPSLYRSSSEEERADGWSASILYWLVCWISEWIFWCIYNGTIKGPFDLGKVQLYHKVSAGVSPSSSGPQFVLAIKSGLPTIKCTTNLDCFSNVGSDAFYIFLHFPTGEGFFKNISICLQSSLFYHSCSFIHLSRWIYNIL